MKRKPYRIKFKGGVCTRAYGLNISLRIKEEEECYGIGLRPLKEAPEGWAQNNVGEFFIFWVEAQESVSTMEFYNSEIHRLQKLRKTRKTQRRRVVDSLGILYNENTKILQGKNTETDLDTCSPF